MFRSRSGARTPAPGAREALHLRLRDWARLDLALQSRVGVLAEQNLSRGCLIAQPGEASTER